jgi:hypothetical protein
MIAKFCDIVSLIRYCEIIVIGVFLILEMYFKYFDPETCMRNCHASLQLNIIYHKARSYFRLSTGCPEGLFLPIVGNWIYRTNIFYWSEESETIMKREYKKF